MKLTCNGKTILATPDTLVVCHSNFICSTVGGNDLCDLGFTFNDIRDHDFTVEVGNTKVIFECEKNHRAKLVARIVTEQKVTEGAARYFLQKHGWHFGMAVTEIRMHRNSKSEPKFCGEIPLGEPGICNLGSDLCQCGVECVPLPNGTCDHCKRQRITAGMEVEFVDAPFRPPEDFKDRLRHRMVNETFAKLYGGANPLYEPSEDNINKMKLALKDAPKMSQEEVEASIAKFFPLDQVEQMEQKLREDAAVTTRRSAEIKIEGSYDSFWCGCQNGMVGTEHCPVHGSKPMGVTPPAPVHCVCVVPKINSLTVNGCCETCRRPIIRNGGV